MSKNVSIVVVLLVLVVIAGYLIWLRSRVQPAITPVVQVTPTVSASATASSSATPTQEATASAKPKSATSSSTRR